VNFWGKNSIFKFYYVAFWFCCFFVLFLQLQKLNQQIEEKCKVNDSIGISIDLNEGTVKFYKNNKMMKNAIISGFPKNQSFRLAAMTFCPNTRIIIEKSFFYLFI